MTRMSEVLSEDDENERRMSGVKKYYEYIMIEFYQKRNNNEHFNHRG